MIFLWIDVVFPCGANGFTKKSPNDHWKELNAFCTSGGLWRSESTKMQHQFRERPHVLIDTFPSEVVLMHSKLKWHNNKQTISILHSEFERQLAARECTTPSVPPRKCLNRIGTAESRLRRGPWLLILRRIFTQRVSLTNSTTVWWCQITSCYGVVTFFGANDRELSVTARDATP